MCNSFYNGFYSRSYSSYSSFYRYPTRQAVHSPTRPTTPPHRLRECFASSKYTNAFHQPDKKLNFALYASYIDTLRPLSNNVDMP